MAIALTQVITEDRASGAQVIDGSLKFVSGNSTHLTRTPSGAGNRRTWTFSCWVKVGSLSQGERGTIFQSNSSVAVGGPTIYQNNGLRFALAYDPSGTDNIRETVALYRDPSAWYHVVWWCDMTQAGTRWKIYVNGVEQTLQTPAIANGEPAQNTDLNINTADEHTIGNFADYRYLDGYLSQAYFVDGQALDASYFGFTDGLTNTWRPKKYTGTYGTNGFYLPLDGNSPIGEDKSGNGNDFTPVGFGGSNTIEKATGALPILNTVNGGNVAAPGVFGSKVSKTLTTTASTNTSNGFVFANEGTKPTLSFIRGATYTFDYSASTGHPLRFATAADAAGSTEYTDGTDTSVANTVKITVPHNAPDTLYYYCTNHGGMGNSISVTTDEKVADPYAWKCVLALPLVGSAADESNKLNVGSTTKTLTANGNAAASSAQSNFYGGSYYFDGNGDYLSAPDSDDFHIGSSDFTVEGWVWKANKGSLSTFIGQRESSTLEWRILLDYTLPDAYSEGAIRVEWGSGQYVFATGVVQHSRWNHIAMVREGTTVTIYVNGVNIGSQTLSNVGNFSGPLRIGSSNGAGEFLQGYVNDVRIYNGVAKYTSNFVPASTDPDILPDTPSGVAGGSALATLSESTTEGSVYFDGSADYLSLANSTDFDVAAGDFTAEGYFYFTNQSSSGTCFFGKWANTPGRNYALVYIKSGNQYRFSWSSNGTDETLYTSSGAYPGDVNRWVHLAVVRNGTTLKVYRDGKEIISASIGSSTIYNSSTSFMVGRFESNTNYDYSGWISNFRFVKGTAVYTAEFTPPTEPLTNVTNTKLLCCKNSSSATASDVTPGTITANGNTVGGKFRPFQGEDINTVRGQESGWCTLNPLAVRPSYVPTFSEGNLKVTHRSGTGAYSFSGSTFAFSSDDSAGFYCEVQNGAQSYGGVALIVADYGVHRLDPSVSVGYSLNANGGIGYDSNGYIRNFGTTIDYTSSYSYNGGSDILGISVKDNKVWFSINGIWIAGGNPSTGANPVITLASTQTFIVGSYGQGSRVFIHNFGQKPFKYAPPEGFKTLCLANLPRPTKVALQPDKYFGTITWTGDASGATRTFGGLKFSPDLVWVKGRNQAISHQLTDTVRGAGATSLRSDDNRVEGADGTSSGYLSAFTSDGFTATSSSTNVYYNTNTYTYVAWCWKAGGAAVSNTDGSITSQVSANQDAGFSIVTYTSPNDTADQTVGHGLAVKPSLIMVKNRDNTYNWDVYHSSLGYNASLILSSTNSTRSGAFGAEPTSTVFTTKTSYTHNLTQKYVAYCWSEVPGFSKFGSFTGNGSADGPFVHCGFRPAWIMLKRSNGVESWQLVDTARSTYNPMTNYMSANTSNAEASAVVFWDQLSNGFKLRNGGVYVNGSSDTYIFAAFAEAPTQNLFGGQANAR